MRWEGNADRQAGRPNTNTHRRCLAAGVNYTMFWGGSSVLQGARVSAISVVRLPEIFVYVSQAYWPWFRFFFFVLLYVRLKREIVDVLSYVCKPY